MPKKFVGENTKATAAKAAKAAKLKEEKERKEAEQRARKQELKVLADVELEKAAGGGKHVQAESSSVAKVTQHQLDKRREALEQQAKEEEQRRHLRKQSTRRLICSSEEFSVENIRECLNAQFCRADTTADDVDRHPEKRLRAAYTAFEERRIEALKKEWPTLRISQLKQMVDAVGFE
ncbi:unnamed protein product [Sphagnum balticum]